MAGLVLCMWVTHFSMFWGRLSRILQTYVLFPKCLFFLQVSCQSSHVSHHQLILINKELGCLIQVGSMRYTDMFSQPTSPLNDRAWHLAGFMGKLVLTDSKASRHVTPAYSSLTPCQSGQGFYSEGHHHCKSMSFFKGWISSCRLGNNSIVRVIKREAGWLFQLL